MTTPFAQPANTHPDNARHCKYIIRSPMPSAPGVPGEPISTRHHVANSAVDPHGGEGGRSPTAGRPNVSPKREHRRCSRGSRSGAGKAGPTATGPSSTPPVPNHNSQPLFVFRHRLRLGRNCAKTVPKLCRSPRSHNFVCDLVLPNYEVTCHQQIHVPISDRIRPPPVPPTKRAVRQRIPVAPRDGVVGGAGVTVLVDWLAAAHVDILSKFRTANTYVLDQSRN